MSTLPLDGAWRLAWNDHHRGLRPPACWADTIDERRTIAALVPGEVHLDCERAGLIADVNFGLNVLAARWVEEVLWTYRRSVEVPAEALAGRAWLVFDGLDHDAVIALNGNEVGRHSGSFHPCRIEVTGSLKAGWNLVAVTLDSGLYAAADKPGADFGGADSILHKRHWLRKPQNQFGWDWSPRLINVGIHRSCRLEWTAETVRPDQLAVTSLLSSDLATGTVQVRWHVEGLADATEVELEATVAGQRVSTTSVISRGRQVASAQVSVDRPRLWWPVGHGEAHREAVTVTLRVAGVVIATRTVLIGFRHIVMDQSPHPDGGRFCILVINGRRIFCKGGNLVPADLITARIDRARYEGLIDRAVESNFNLLRVWGGGLYESDDLYDLCDERGILVWQEFIFACSRYPGTDDTFYRLVADEATYQLRRLAHRPSLVVWCGNNENEMAAWSWGYAEKRVLPDYHIYHHLLPRLVATEDGSRHWQPSSPWSPDGLHPNADEAGDQHPWSVGFHNTDFRDYRKMACRFPNEGGILGPNSLATVLECLPDGQRQVGSFAWQQHDNTVNSWIPADAIDTLLERWTGKRAHDLSVAEYVYWGGLVHGEGLRTYIDNFRRRMFDSAAAVFWMFNDCWPCTRSWTTVDYRLRRTPAFHPVRRAFAPFAVVVTEDGTTVTVHGVNDGRDPIQAELRCGILALAGGWVHEQRTSATLAANASTVLGQFPKALWTDPTRQLAVAELRNATGELLGRHRLILPLFRELVQPPAALEVTVAAGRARFTSPVFVLGVCLDLDGEAALADNFFDVWPGITYELPWAFPTAPAVLHTANPCAPERAGHQPGS